MLIDKLLSNLSVYVKPFALCTLDEGWRLHLPGPSGLLFHFVLRGEGMLYGPDGDQHPIFPGHLAVVPIGAKHVMETNGEIHDVLRIDAPPPGEQVCRIEAGTSDQPDLIVGCGLVNVRYGPSLDLFDHLPGVLSVDMSDSPEMFHVYQGILAEQSKPDAGSNAMTAALMTQCLVHLFRRLPSEDGEALPWLTALEDKRLGNVVDMILDNPGADYTVDTMAETAAMSRSAFAEHFVESFGRTPMNFVNHMRMQRAAQMLAVENSTIDEIARTVGYSSRSHFSRAFKDHAGLPPNAFRAECLAG
ncbi:MAG: helix-turn-helix domain-containing protein [Alphaproteobacteria bacterium]|nr:helix-turn-helix domain-containing protein [Alphaproteobacteria bacterium]